MSDSLSDNSSNISQEGNKFGDKFGKFKKIILGILAVAILFFLANQIFSEISVKFRKQYPQAEKFEIVETAPKNFEVKFSIIGQPTIVFSQKLSISEKDLEKYISIQPQVNGKWKMEKNQQVVYLSSERKEYQSFSSLLSYNTSYTISVKKSLGSKLLPDDYTVRFKTEQNPKFNFEVEKKLINNFPNEKITVKLNPIYPYTNSNNLSLPSFINVAIQTSSEDQIINYFSYNNKNDYNLPYTYTQSSFNKKIAHFNAQVSKKDNDFFIDLPLLSKPGIYFVKLYLKENDDKSGSDDFFIVVSNHVNQVFIDSKNSRVLTTDKSGKNLQGFTARLYKIQKSKELIDSGTTSEKGIFLSSKRMHDIDLVITQKGDDIAVTRAQTDEHSFTNNVKIFSFSDRPVYRPEDTVHYKAILREKNNGTYNIPKRKVYLNFDTDYSSPKYQEVEIDEDGTVNYDFILPKNTTSLSPFITLSLKNKDSYQQIDSLYLLVESYRKPDLDLTVNSKEEEYISQDEAHATVLAKTLYQKPLGNIEFSYRVLVNPYTEIKDRNIEQISENAINYYGSGETLITGDGAFDEKGKAIISFSTNLGNLEESQIATIEITPKIGVSPSIAKIAKLIHRGEFAIFFENVKGSIDEGIKGTIENLNHQKPRTSVPNVKTSLSLYKFIDYQKKDFVEKQELTSNDQGKANFEFNRKDEGSYELIAEAKDARGNIIKSKYTLYVGKPYTVTNQKPSETLNITSNKESYQPDETALITLTSTFPLSDIVVVSTTQDEVSWNRENSTILEFNQLSINKENVTIPVKINNNQITNVGISAFAVYNGVVYNRYINLGVKTEKKKLTTTISFNKKSASPKDTIEAEISTTDNNGNPVSSDNSLSLIDAAVLQIGKFSSDIFDSFYGGSSYPIISSFNSTTGISRYEGGGGMGGCFLQGTKIRMKNGTLKNIEEVKIGDTITTRLSDLSSELIEDKVTKTFKHIVSEYITVNDTLNITPIHRIFVNNTWKQAKDIKIGDKLLNENGEYIRVNSLETHNGTFAVYNLTTKEKHTFFAQGFYVHNEKGETRKNFADTAYWNPHIKTDQNGKAKVSIKLPDNTTTLTAFVISNTKDSLFGQATNEIISQKDITIIPSLPTFFYQEDKSTISALIQNSSNNDLNATYTLSIKELGFSKTQNILLKSNDFEYLSFPVEISQNKNQLSFEFTVTDNTTSKTQDSVLIKKQVIPKGNISTDWKSFDKSTTLQFYPKFPELDFNSFYLSVVPHIASQIFNKGIYMSQDITAYTGKDLYTKSYILAKTQNGDIPPHVFNYATLKHEFRTSIEKILKNRVTYSGNSYWYPSYYGNQTNLDLITTLWIFHGLQQANKYGLLEEINGLQSILESTQRYITSTINEKSTQALTDEEKIIAAWALERYQNLLDKDSLELLAIKGLKGDLASLSELKKKRIQTADDRYLWDGYTDYAQILPVLAMVEKGTKEDGDKAIKGLSILYQNYSTSDNTLTFLAGIEHALRYNILFPSNVKIMSDNQILFDSKDEKRYFESYSHTFVSNNDKNKKMNFEVKVSDGLPFYTTAIWTEYKTTEEKQTFSLFSGSQRAKVLEIPLEKTIKNINDRTDLYEVKNGTTAIMQLYFKNPYKLYRESYYGNNIYTFQSIDAINPSHMILNGYSGNSPQYQNALKGYLVPVDFSDQIAYFNNNPTLESQDYIFYGYVVYGISEGSYFQPKTSLVFPKLGIVIKEK